MTPLPAHIARCKGQLIRVDGVIAIADQCQACRRHTDPPRARQVWTGTPEETPCALRIGEAEEV
jgi:hypothetical protein